MTEQKVYLGSHGPGLFDDTDLINDADGEFPLGTFEALTTTGQLRVEGTPTESYHVARLEDLGGRLLPPVAVVDISDPVELGLLSGDSNGSLVVAYELSLPILRATLYVWHSGGTTDSPPFIVDGAGGKWIAVGGMYNYYRTVGTFTGNLYDSTSTLIATVQYGLIMDVVIRDSLIPVAGDNFIFSAGGDNWVI